jgi:hypothetical protein
MNIDPGKISEQIGETWRASPLIFGVQVLTLALLGFFAYDRFETRNAVLGFVTDIMAKQDERNQAMVDRLNHLTQVIVECYEHERALEPKAP